MQESFGINDIPSYTAWDVPKMLLDFMKLSDVTDDFWYPRCSALYVILAISHIPYKLRPLYGFLSADVDKAVWVSYEDGLMTFYTSN